MYPNHFHISPKKIYKTKSTELSRFKNYKTYNKFNEEPPPKLK